MSTNKVYRVAGLSGTQCGSFTEGGIATTNRIGGPTGLALDATGTMLYISEVTTSAPLVNRVSVVNLTAGTITTFAGTGTGGFSGDGGPATSAQVSSPQQLRLDRQGRLLIPDQVRQIRINGVPHQPPGGASIVPWSFGPPSRLDYTACGFD